MKLNKLITSGTLLLSLLGTPNSIEAILDKEPVQIAKNQEKPKYMYVFEFDKEHVSVFDSL